MWSSSSWSLATGAATPARLPAALLQKVRPGPVLEKARLARQHHRRPRSLLEVEVGDEVAEQRRVLANGRTWIGTAVSGRIQPLAFEKVVLDELRIGVEAQDLVVYEAASRVRRDDESRNPEPIAVPIDDGRRYVVVEAAPVVPGDEDRGRLPVGAAHDRVPEPRHPGLARADERRRMLADLVIRDHPVDGREVSVLRGREEVIDGLDVPQLAILAHVGEIRQGIPDSGCLRALRLRLAEHGAVVVAIGLAAFEDVVAPGDVMPVEEIGEIGPRVVGILAVRAS